MNKNEIAVASAMFFCAISFALAQRLQSPQPDAAGHQQSAAGNTDRNIMSVSPKKLAALKEMGILDTAGAAALDAGQYGVAEEDERRSLSYGIGAGFSEELLAATLDAEGKTQEALQAYKVMADQGEEAPRDLLPYALLLLKTGQWAPAVAAYNRQLPFLAEGDLMQENSHFSPINPQPRELATAIHIALGSTYTWYDSIGRHSQTGKAVTEFQQAMTLAPDSALAHLYYGRLLQHLGRGAEAKAAYVVAAELGEGDVKVAAEKETAGR